VTSRGPVLFRQPRVAGTDAGLCFSNFDHVR
jgi:hypothetical protein